MHVILPEIVLQLGAPLIQQWKQGRHSLKFGMKESDMVLLLGGSAAWKLVKGLPLDSTDDIDFYFQGVPEVRVAVDRLRENIGSLVATLLGCSRQEILTHKNKFTDDQDPSKSYYLIKRFGVDYNIGSREIYSNFQVSINVETGEVCYDSRIPSHENDFRRFLYFGEIMTYNFPGLVLNVLNETNNSLQFKHFSVLSFVFKSYVKPLSFGMHFDKNTANELLVFKSRSRHAYLISTILQRLINFYSADPQVLDQIFAVAQHDLSIHPILKDLKKAHGYKQAERTNAQLSQAITELTQTVASGAQENKSLKTSNKKLSNELDATKTQLAEQKDLLQTEKDTSTNNAKTHAKEVEKLQGDLLTIQTAMGLLNEQVEEICRLVLLAIFLKNRLLGTVPQITSVSQALQSATAEFNQIKHSSDMIENTQLEVAAATFTCVSGYLASVMACYEKILEFKGKIGASPKEQATVLLLELDVLYDKQTHYRLSAQERHTPLIQFIRLILLFLKTDFVTSVHPTPHPNAVLLQSYLASPEHIQELQLMLKEQEKIKAYLDKNHKTLSVFLDKSVASNSSISEKLESVLDELLGLEGRLKIEHSEVSGFACEHYLLQHDYNSEQFTRMFNTYRDHKQTRRRMEITDLWNARHKSMMVPPHKSSEKVKQRYMGKENSQLFMKGFFNEVNQKFPSNFSQFLIRAHFISLKLHHSTWLTSKQWLGHPLLKHLSMVFSAEAKARICHPSQWAAFITEALLELQSSSLFPESVYDKEEPQNTRNLLREIIESYLSIMPQDDQELLTAYRMLVVYLSQAIPVSNVFSFSRNQLVPSPKDELIQEERLAATLFLSKFVKNHTPFLVSDLMILGKHLVGLTQDTLESVGVLMRKVIEQKAGKNQDYAREFCALISKTGSVMANLGKFMRLFKEKEVLDRVSITGREEINELILSALRLSPKYKIKSDNPADPQNIRTAPQGSQGSLHMTN